MAKPSTPTGYNIQTGNRAIYLSWDLSVGATSYDVKRSVDGILYASVGTPTVPSLLDTSVVVGVQYWYQVAAVNADGPSPYTDPQSIVPAPTSEMSLGQLRLSCQQRADRVGSSFVTIPEWNSYINQSMYELYDLLITADEEYFVATPVSFTATGTDYLYPLPNGGIPFANGITGAPGFLAPPFYKLKGVDLNINSANNAWVTLNKFSFIDRNRYVYPTAGSSIFGVFNPQYRLMGANIEFIPTPQANLPIRLWYIPRLTQLLADTDITDTGISGWLEYVIVDAAIKALQKEESDVSILLAQKAALILRIEGASTNRDTGQPDTISDIRRSNGGGWGTGGWGNGPFGGM